MSTTNDHDENLNNMNNVESEMETVKIRQREKISKSDEDDNDTNNNTGGHSIVSFLETEFLRWHRSNEIPSSEFVNTEKLNNPKSRSLSLDVKKKPIHVSLKFNICEYIPVYLFDNSVSFLKKQKISMINLLMATFFFFFRHYNFTFFYCGACFLAFSILGGVFMFEWSIILINIKAIIYSLSITLVLVFEKFKTEFFFWCFGEYQFELDHDNVYERSEKRENLKRKKLKRIFILTKILPLFILLLALILYSSNDYLILSHTEIENVNIATITNQHINANFKMDHENIRKEMKLYQSWKNYYGEQPSCYEIDGSIVTMQQNRSQSNTTNILSIVTAFLKIAKQNSMDFITPRMLIDMNDWTSRPPCICLVNLGGLGKDTIVPFSSSQSNFLSTDNDDDDDDDDEDNKNIDNNDNNNNNNYNIIIQGESKNVLWSVFESPTISTTKNLIEWIIAKIQNNAFFYSNNLFKKIDSEQDETRKEDTRISSPGFRNDFKKDDLQREKKYGTYQWRVFINPEIEEFDEKDFRVYDISELYILSDRPIKTIKFPRKITVSYTAIGNENDISQHEEKGKSNKREVVVLKNEDVTRILRCMKYMGTRK